MNKHYQTDVIIVGGGPVGIGLAIDLAMSGVSSIIIERHQNIQRIPKGQNLTPELENIFAVGVSQTQSVPLHLFHERTGAAE